MATRVRVTPIMDGPGPDETIVSISKKGGGEEELILPKTMIKNNYIEVGMVGETGDRVLIELPQESTSGSWRVWVDRGTLESESAIAAPKKAVETRLALR